MAFMVVVAWLMLSARYGALIRPLEFPDAASLAIGSLARVALFLIVVPAILVALYWNFAIFVGAITLWGSWRGAVAFVLVHVVGRYCQFFGFMFALFLLWRLSLAVGRESESPR